MSNKKQEEQKTANDAAEIKDVSKSFLNDDKENNFKRNQHDKLRNSG